jgi:hypothetical protein
MYVHYGDALYVFFAYVVAYAPHTAFAYLHTHTRALYKYRHVPHSCTQTHRHTDTHTETHAYPHKITGEHTSNHTHTHTRSLTHSLTF